MASLKNIPSSFEVTHEMLAGKNKRFFNYVIDMIVMYMLIFFLGMIAAFIAILFELDDMLVWMQNIPTFQSYSIGICVVLLYYGLPETFSSRTLGKLITGTKVVMAETGTKPGTDIILKRTLCRLIPFEVFSFLGEHSRGWHDSISRTVVVDVKKYEAELYLKKSLDELGKNQDVA